jgi:hypothetical protein
MRLPKEHRVVAQAHADGSENLPESSDPTPNAIQTQIVEKSEQSITALRAQAQDRLERCQRELERHELTPVDLDITGPADEATHTFVLIRGSTRDLLIERRVVEREMYQELRYFKADHCLYRSAFYLPSRTLACALLLTVIVGEALLNAKLFASVDPMGLLGGWLQALIISVLNVLPSFLVGILVLRNLHHVRLWRRFLATNFLLIYTALIIAYNLLVAHYRIALSLDPARALELATPSLFYAPFLIGTNLEALMLFLLGLFASVIAMLDGYTLFDDRYPGFGKIDRRYREKLKSYDEAKRQFRHDIEAVVTKASRVMDRRLLKLQRKVNVATKVMSTGMQCLSRTQEEADQIARECERLLRVYREENKRVRSTPAPPHFEHYPALEPILGVSLHTLDDKRRGMREALKDKMKEVAGAKRRLRLCAEQEIAGLSGLVDKIEETTATTGKHEPAVTLLEATAA